MNPHMNEYLRAMDTGARDLEGFSAVVYCEGLDFEIDHATTTAADADADVDGDGSRKEEENRGGHDVVAGSIFENVWGKAIAGGVEG